MAAARRFVFVFGPPESDIHRAAEVVSEHLGNLPIIDPLQLLEQRQHVSDDVANYIQRSTDPDRLTSICSQLVAQSCDERGAVIIQSEFTSFDSLDDAMCCALDATNFSKGTNRNATSRDAYDKRVSQWTSEGIPIHKIPPGDDATDWSTRLPFRRLPQPPNDDFGAACTKSNAIDAAQITQMCLRLCESHIMLFPGTHPVQVTRDTMTGNLKNFPYCVSKKIDGTRYMMIIGRENALWFMNRRMDVWRGPSNDKLSRFRNSVFDVEVRNGTVTIIDVINSSGQCVRSSPLFHRMNAAKQLLGTIGPLVGTLQLQLQTYHPMNKLRDVVATTTDDDQFDGLVFTPKRTSYRLGRNDNLLKWKPKEKNTIDFAFKEGNIYSETVCYGHVVGVPEDVQTDEIIECTLERDIWVFHRVRRDKTNPNARWIVDNILQSIQDDITIEELTTTIVSQ